MNSNKILCNEIESKKNKQKKISNFFDINWNNIATDAFHSIFQLH